MLDVVPNDDEMFDVLCAVIRGRIPKFRVRYKNESKWQRFIGKLAFFNPKYMTNYISTFGTDVFYPNREFVQENKWLSFKILAHEYVHLLDRKKNKGLFELGYALPQFLGILAIGAILSIFFSNWWLLCLSALLFFAPLPALFRAVIEMRGYTMSMAVNYWRHGTIVEKTKEMVTEQFCGWSYYKMYPFKGAVRKWIDRAERRIMNMDTVGEQSTDVIFNDSEAYSDVYSLMTGVEFE